MTGVSRRAFAESALAAALVPLLGPLPRLPAAWWTVAAGAADPAAAGGDLDALAEALAGVVRAQYGDRLGPEELSAVTRQIRGALGLAEQMQAVELANGDEPDFVFAAPPPAAPR